MTNTFIKRENIQQKSKVELSGSEFLKKLEKKKAASKKDWNRNVFTVRTNDDISFLIREYCKENNKPIYGIGFINYLMPEYISTKEKKDNQKKRRAAEMEKAKKRNDELEREQMLLQKYNIMPNHIKSRIMAQAKHKVEDALKDNNNKKIGQYLEKFMIEGYITEIMEDEYSGL